MQHFCILVSHCMELHICCAVLKKLHIYCKSLTVHFVNIFEKKGKQFLNMIHFLNFIVTQKHDKS